MEEKILLPLRNFSKKLIHLKEKIKQKLINILNAENSHMGVPELIQKIKSFFI